MAVTRWLEERPLESRGRVAVQAVGWEKAEPQLPSPPGGGHTQQANGSQGLRSLVKGISVHRGCLAEALRGGAFLRAVMSFAELIYEKQ